MLARHSQSVLMLKPCDPESTVVSEDAGPLSEAVTKMKVTAPADAEASFIFRADFVEVIADSQYTVEVMFDAAELASEEVVYLADPDPGRPAFPSYF